MEIAHFLSKHVSEFAENLLVPRVVLEAHFGLNLSKLNCNWSELVFHIRGVKCFTGRP